MQTISLKDFAYSLGLNGEVALKQRIGREELEQIKALHLKVRELDIKNQQDAPLSLSRKASIQLIKDVMALEYEMQELWKFPKLTVFHSHTFNLKTCTCNCIKVSNFRFPRGFGVAHSFKKSCHLHGDGKVAEAFGITPEEAYTH